MNQLLGLLQPYPFERLRALFADVRPNSDYRPISLGIGEPRHATPAFIAKAYADAITREPSGLASYPSTDTATIEYQGARQELQIAVSASGARYVGKGFEWWTKGSGAGSEGPLFQHMPDGTTCAITESCTAS